MGRLSHGSVHLVMAVLCFAAACLSAQSSPGRLTCPLPADDSQLSGVPGTVASSSCFAALQRCRRGPGAVVSIWLLSPASSLLQGSVHSARGFAPRQEEMEAQRSATDQTKRCARTSLFSPLLIRKKSQGMGTSLIDSAFGNSAPRALHRAGQHPCAPTQPSSSVTALPAPWPSIAIKTRCYLPEIQPSLYFRAASPLLLPSNGAQSLLPPH